MSDPGTLEALQALHRELLAACDHRFENGPFLAQSLLDHGPVFRKLLDKPARDAKSRAAVESGKIKIADDEYALNPEFADHALRLADELELDEVEAARLLLEAQADRARLGRSLLECGLIRFHQQRKYLLDCVRLCLQLAADDDLDPPDLDFFGAYVAEHIYGDAVPGAPPPAPAAPAARAQKMVPRCLAAMQDIKAWLQRIAEKVATTSLMYQAAQPAVPPEFQEAVEFSRISLLQQHELLAVILCAAVEKRQAGAQDLEDLIATLKRVDKYDPLLVHLLPALGAFIAVFGSPEGNGDLVQARRLNDVVCKPPDDAAPWLLPYLGAAVRVWWIAEYSGWYVDDLPADSAFRAIDVDREDRERAKQFLDALKEGAFDFLLAVAADCRAPDWQDPARSGVRQWLQRKAPPLPAADGLPPFSDFFQRALAVQLEVFIDGFISNLPDVLRRLRVEEDEQRQLSPAHEQDLDLERFLVLIAYAYEGRPDAADAFWSDPDSNLSGFLHWASRRASTPLVSAFCEMMRALADSEDGATAAHQFLLDDGHASSGKMRRTQSLTWSQIFRELNYFTHKIRERPSPAAPSHVSRGGGGGEPSETEPESAMLLECYLRLITKLAATSETARRMLLRDPAFNLVEILFQLASSPIPARLRASVFYALRALLARKSRDDSLIMWRCVDAYMTGGYAAQASSLSSLSSSSSLPVRAAAAGHGAGPTPRAKMEAIFREIGEGFEEPNAFVQFLIALVAPPADADPLHDALPFPEDLGASVRMPGIEVYVDYVLGHVFAARSRDVSDPAQLRVLRLTCLDFAMACLATFNEDLLVLANQSNVDVDAAVSTTDLATYVRLHPFARAMEWMFNDAVVHALFATIHQDAAEVGRADPESPLILGILRGVEVVTKVLDLQATYLDLVRPALKQHQHQHQHQHPHQQLSDPPHHRRGAVANSAYASFEDGLLNHLDLVVDLARFCGLGDPALTLACLTLLERISTSPRIVSAWNPDAGLHGRGHGHRNKAIVALEANGEAEATAICLSSELAAPLDFSLRAEAPNYAIKLLILDFLYACLRADPDRPTVAHLLLGFRCGADSLAVEPQGAFDRQDSLFHSILAVLLEVPYGEHEEDGIRRWLVALKAKALRILQVLWNAPLSAPLVLDELRSLQLPFHLLLRDVLIQPHLRWDGLAYDASPEFLVADASLAYLDFLAMRAMAFEYIGIELCSVSQSGMPAPKREMLDALLAGRFRGDENETITVPNAFDLFDFLPVEDPLALVVPPPPEFRYCKDLDLRACVVEAAAADDDDLVLYDVDKVRELLQLKHNESRHAQQVVSDAALAAMEREEMLLLEYLTYAGRVKTIAAARRRVLRAWTRLVLVMIETNDFRGSDQTSFLQQALQAILPALDAVGLDGLPEAFELANLANVLLFKTDFSLEPLASSASAHGAEDDGRPLVPKTTGGGGGTPISDKLFQLFQICLDAIGRWAGDAELRSVYYSVCYRYLTGVVDRGRGLAADRQRTVRAVQLQGERLLNVVCDDAYGSDLACQTTAVILLGALVTLGTDEDDTKVVETLNKLNFVGVLVDSLKNLRQEWLEIVRTGNTAAEQYTNAKLALLLQLCQTRAGAKHVLHANLFRALELSGLFAADPELEVDPADARALEKHYGLLARVARVVAAAVLGRGSHGAPQGRRFLAQHRLLVVHTLKRSAGIGSVGNGAPRTGVAAAGSGVVNGARAREELDERIAELAEAFMVLITATEFLEYEDGKAPPERSRGTPTLFH